MKNSFWISGIAALVLTGCANSGKNAQSAEWFDGAVKNASEQMALQIEAIEADTSSKVLNPVTVKRNRFSTSYCGYADWRSGFFPGSVWYLYELTGDSTLVPLAEKYTEAIAEAQHLTSHHDIGFIINCS